MRAPTFLSELSAYREALLKDNSDLKGRALIEAVLDRWRDRADAEKIWEKITTALVANKTQPPAAALFIAWLLQTRIRYEWLDAQTKHAPIITSDLRNKAAQEWKSGDPISAAFHRIGAQAYADWSQQAGVTLSRKKAKALQKRFISTLRESFIANCGKPLNEVVTTLTQIAFGGDVDIQDVRDALKPTRQDIRRKKSR
jgi:hypothetical protein